MFNLQRNPAQSSQITGVNSSTSAKQGQGTLTDDYKNLIKEKGNSNYSKFVIGDPSWAIKYLSIKDMAKDADLIVDGTICKEKGTTLKIKGDYQNYYLDSSLKVDKVLKGDASLVNTEITISQSGGQDDTVQVISKDVTPLKTNNHTILFLRKNSSGSYNLINEDEGIFMSDNTSSNYINKGSKLTKDDLLKEIINK